ncbi:MAG TPA: hypothetical protein PLL69_01660 [Gemmatimonadales bacterium]|nr:hypothetical protein [Gemmatimonadales bacterium]
MKTRALTFLAAAITLAACGSELSPEAAAQIETRVAEAITAADTAELAKLAEQRCSSLGTDSRRDCYEDYFLSLADSGRTALALGALAKLGEKRGEVEADGHSLTHVIGISAWKPGDDVTEVFKSCSTLYQSGCYHGVIQAWLTSGTVDSTRTSSLCDEIAPGDTDYWLRFQCVHGLGHGLEMAWNWDLPRALAGCDWLPSTWDQDSCYGGAIMENSVASMPGGHHTSVRALEATGDDHGHGGHGGHGASSEPITFKMRDSTDALYPCTILDDQYLRACYLGQGNIILSMVDWDFGRAARQCDRVDTRYRNVCYTSLGTNASGWSVRDTRKSINACNKGDPDWRQWCHVGVVKNFIDVTADPQDGIDYCNALPAGRDRDACWIAVGEQLVVRYTADRDARSRVCATTGDGEALCRQGAGIAVEIKLELAPASP